MCQSAMSLGLADRFALDISANPAGERQSRAASWRQLRAFWRSATARGLGARRQTAAGGTERERSEGCLPFSTGSPFLVSGPSPTGTRRMPAPGRPQESLRVSSLQNSARNNGEPGPPAPIAQGTYGSERSERLPAVGSEIGKSRKRTDTGILDKLSSVKTSTLYLVVRRSLGGQPAKRSFPLHFWGCC